MKFSNVLSKSLLLFLVLVLVLGGFGSTLFIGSNEEYVAKIGKDKIYAQEYMATYNDELKYIQQLLNHTLSEEQIRDFNIRYSVLNKLIEKKVLSNFINSLNLKIGEESLKDHTRGTKYFQDINGNFDKKKFNDILANAGMTEVKYIQSLEKAFPIMMLMSCLFGESSNAYIQYDDKLIQEIYKHRHQLRIADVITISPTAVKNVSQPTTEMLKELYEKNSRDFVYPEYRSIEYVTIGPEDVEDQINITQEEIDNKIKESGLEDQRDILNLVFTTEEKAKDAVKELKGGIPFEKVVTQFGHTESSITLENITKNMLPENIRNKVFSLKEGEVSDILQSIFGWHIIKVKNIHTISQEDLEEVRSRVRLMINQHKASDLVSKIVKEMDEQIDKGLLIKDFASANNLKINTISAVDINGQDILGNKVQGIPEFENFLVTAFSRPLNRQDSFTSNDSNHYFNVYVKEIIPSRVKTFEESKTALAKILQNKSVNDKLYELAKDTVLKFKTGTNIEKIYGVSLAKKQKIYRPEFASVENPSQNYPAMLVDEIFTINKGDATNPIKNKNELLVAVLRDIQAANSKISQLELNTIKNDIGNNNIESLREDFMKHLIKKQAIEINKHFIDHVK